MRDLCRQLVCGLPVRDGARGLGLAASRALLRVDSSNGQLTSARPPPARNRCHAETLNTL